MAPRILVRIQAPEPNFIIPLKLPERKESPFILHLPLESCLSKDASYFKLMNFTEDSKSLELFAVSPPGIEKLLVRELSALGIEGVVKEGGVSFHGGLREMLLANLWLRTASRVLLRVARFRALSFPELIRKTERYPWELYLPEGYGVRIRVTSYRSKLYHERAVKERILKALENRLGRDPEETFEREILIVVRLVKDRCTISVDTSGGDLFRRGYKVAPGRAALRENLAAALILSSGWDRRTPLLDPFCGTGTIPAEAAMMAAGRAPGIFRRFPFEDWPEFDQSLWEELKNKARAREKPAPAHPFIFAGDASPKALSATRENLQAAGLAPWVKTFRSEIRDLFPPTSTPGVLITDPPYGKRLFLKDREAFYRSWGKILRERFRGWRLLLIFPETGTRELSHLTGLRFRKILSTEHGGLRCAFLSSSL